MLILIGIGVGMADDQGAPKDQILGSSSQVVLSNELMRSLMPTLPIEILHNNDFYGFPGNGSETNPYIIEDKLIKSDSEHLIEIEDTTAYFIIRNCILDGGVSSRAGIMLENVTHGTILNNTITDIPDDGIDIRNCSYNIIHRNTIFNCKQIGIHLSGYTITTSGVSEYQVSIRNNITDNVIYNCIGGMTLSSTAYNIVENNTIFDGSTVDSNRFNGITLLGRKDLYKKEFLSGNHLIQDNLISDFEIGIHIQEAINNSILNNTIHKNENVGLYAADASENNLIKWNDFIYNSPAMPKPTRPQASGRGLNNTFTHNFWDDGRLPDKDVNGFADEPYLLAGDNKDEFPLSQYNNPQTSSFDIIARPIVLSPSASEPAQGTTEIRWAPAIDYQGHAITYDLYYSTDWFTDETWTEIITGISDTNYEWEAPDSSGDCRIKVVATCAEGESVEAFSETVQLKLATPGWSFLTLFSVLCLIVGFRRIHKRNILSRRT